MKHTKPINILRKSVLFLFIFFFSSVNAQKTVSIEEAINIALKYNFDIQTAKNDETISKVNNTPGNAGMLPTVGINGSGTYTHSSSNQKSGSDAVTNSTSSGTSLNIGPQLNWTLYDGGKMFVTKNRLNEIQALGEIQFKEQVLQTLFDVIAAYYDVVRQKQQLNSIEESLNYNNVRLTIANAGFNAGSLLKTDLLQAKIDLNVTTENKINQQYSIDAAVKTLNLLLGRNSEEPIDVLDTIPPAATPDKAGLLTKIDNSNTSILSAQKQIDIARLALKENRSLYLPNLDFKAGYYLSHTNNSAGSVIRNNSFGPQVGGTLTIPIYSAGETKRKVTTAKIQTESAELDLQSMKLQVNALLQNTLIEFENQQQLLKIETENNGLAKENLQISLDRLKHGQATSLEVHQAQENYVQSNTRLINFRYNLKMAETKLKQLVSSL